MVIEIKVISLLSKVCILGVLTQLNYKIVSSIRAFQHNCDVLELYFGLAATVELGKFDKTKSQNHCSHNEEQNLYLSVNRTNTSLFSL